MVLDCVISMPKNFLKIQYMAPLVNISEKGGEGLSLLEEAIEPPSNLIIKRTPKHEVLLRLKFLNTAKLTNYLLSFHKVIDLATKPM